MQTHRLPMGKGTLVGGLARFQPLVLRRPRFLSGRLEGRAPGTTRRTLGIALALLGLAVPARAADVTVQPAPGSGFVVTDNTGGSQRLKVLETGEVFVGGLVGSPPIENQALCFDATTGQVGACPGAPGGAGLVDNGDGTVTDNTTGLMWEKKTGTVGAAVDCSTTTCSDPHDVNNVYQWCQDTTPNDFACDHAGPFSNNPPDGGAFFDFLARVNGTLCAASNCPSLGGHSDWRVPTLSELQTIVDLGAPGCGGGSPCINSAFGQTVPSGYWSSATTAGIPVNAWLVFFNNGGSGSSNKPGIAYVRAVRGGL